MNPMMDTQAGWAAVTEVLRIHAERIPDRTLYLYLEDGERESARLTYGQLYAKALHIAAKLRTMTAAGDRALLLYPPGLEFFRLRQPQTPRPSRPSKSGQKDTSPRWHWSASSPTRSLRLPQTEDPPP